MPARGGQGKIPAKIAAFALAGARASHALRKNGKNDYLRQSGDTAELSVAKCSGSDIADRLIFLPNSSKKALPMKRIASALLIAALLSGCANGNPMMRSDGNVSKGSIGMLAGAAGGAAAGSQIGGGKGNIAAIALGTLGGAFLGKSIGDSLDRADLAYADRTSQQALETARTGQPMSWSNPDSGNSGTITPTNTYQNAGQPCREYTQTINIGGRQEQAHGRACRGADGTWRIQG